MEGQRQGATAPKADGDRMASAGDARASVGLFPTSSRVVFHKAPRVEVIAQVQFPPILRIGIQGQPPADFQERIRTVFPLLELGQAIAPPQGPEGQMIPPQVMQFFAAAMTEGAPTYRFLTEDRSSTVILNQSSLTLSTSAYTRWENFLGNFKLPLSALITEYRPSFFSRVGLRYVNAIEKTKLGFSENVSWSDLITKEVLGELALPAFEKNLVNISSTIRAKIPDGTGYLTFRNGIRTLPGHSENAYLLDFDLHNDQRAVAEEAETRLVHFHQLEGDAFRWCIKRKLHNALKPERT
jgi:uncharacterized protein (TIGR04255 family)